MRFYYFLNELDSRSNIGVKSLLGRFTNVLCLFPVVYTSHWSSLEFQSFTKCYHFKSVDVMALFTSGFLNLDQNMMCCFFENFFSEHIMTLVSTPTTGIRREKCILQSAFYLEGILHSEVT